MKITDDQYFDIRFPSVTVLVKFIPTDNVSYAGGNNPSVKLLNVVVKTRDLDHETRTNIIKANLRNSQSQIPYKLNDEGQN